MIDVLRDTGLAPYQLEDPNLDFGPIVNTHASRGPLYFPPRVNAVGASLRYKIDSADLPSGTAIHVAHGQEVCGMSYSRPIFKTGGARWDIHISGGTWGRASAVIDGLDVLSGSTFRDMRLNYTAGFQLDASIDNVFERLRGLGSCSCLVHLRGERQSNMTAWRDCSGSAMSGSAIVIDGDPAPNTGHLIHGGRFELGVGPAIVVSGTTRLTTIRDVYFELNVGAEDIRVDAPTGHTAHHVFIERCRFSPAHADMEWRIGLYGDVCARVTDCDAQVMGGRRLVHTTGNRWTRHLLRNRLTHDSADYLTALVKDEGSAAIQWEAYP